MSAPLELTLTLYPSPVLRKVTPPISAFDEELQATVTGMLEVMYESGGIGLAAPQVGLGLRLLVINETGDREKADQELVLVNPTITSRGKETTLYEEGCLSFPEIYAEVSRPDACTVEAQDVKGEPLSLELTGFLSRIVQHELDHLEGILLVDRMSAGDKLRNRAALENLVDDYKRSR
jgi:peptide deformylase